MDLPFLFDAIGIIGVAIILLGYLLLQTERITSQMLIYPIINLTGSVLLLVSLFWTWNTPSVVIQVCWIAISLYGIFRILKKRKEES
jgi:lipid-A-disaccharide synthase-like uncharacterized protein